MGVAGARVGALAAALGIGAAVATGLGAAVARAEPGADAADSSANSPSSSPPSDASSAEADDPTSEPAAPSGSGTSEADTTDTGPSEAEMNVDASGGQDNSTNDVGQVGDTADDDGELERGKTSTTTPEPTPQPEEDRIRGAMPTSETASAPRISNASRPAPNVPAASEVAATEPQTL